MEKKKVCDVWIAANKEIFDLYAHSQYVKIALYHYW